MLVRAPRWHDTPGFVAASMTPRPSAGSPPGCSWGLLGRMRYNSANTVFGHNVQDIQWTLREVAEADDDAFPGLAFDSYRRMRKLDGIGLAIVGWRSDAPVAGRMGERSIGLLPRTSHSPSQTLSFANSVPRKNCRRVQCSPLSADRPTKPDHSSISTRRRSNRSVRR